MDHSIANSSSQWLIQTVSETGSTNADLMAAGLAGAPDRSVLRADFQSAGRGRLDRTWEAPRGANLLVSILFRDVPQHIQSLTQVVVLAAAYVARQRCGVEAVLKWPNDILVNGEKLSGILSQAAPATPDGKIPFVVAGLGLNLAWAPPGAASLASCGWTEELTPDQFLKAMLPEIDRLLDIAPEEMHAEYVACLSTLGTRVRAEMPNGDNIVGHAVSVEPDGQLVILDECAVSHRINTADVVHLRPVSD